MKKQKIISIIVLLMLIMGMLSTCVKAESLEFSLEPSTKELKEGDTVTINLKLSSIDMGEDGINTFGGKLVYDENIFEKVTGSSFVSQNNWSIAYNDEETEKKGTFLATINTGTSEDQIIGTLTLKVKTNLKSTTTIVQFIDLSSVADETVELANQVLSFSVTGTVKDADKNKDTQTDNTEGIVIQNKINEPVTNSNKEDTTVSEKKIPQTGVQSVTLIIAITIILCVVIAISAIIKYRKNKGVF